MTTLDCRTQNMLRLCEKLKNGQWNGPTPHSFHDSTAKERHTEAMSKL